MLSLSVICNGNNWERAGRTVSIDEVLACLELADTREEVGLEEQQRRKFSPQIPKFLLDDLHLSWSIWTQDKSASSKCSHSLPIVTKAKESFSKEVPMTHSEAKVSPKDSGQRPQYRFLFQDVCRFGELESCTVPVKQRQNLSRCFFLTLVTGTRILCCHDTGTLKLNSRSKASGRAQAIKFTDLHSDAI